MYSRIIATLALSFIFYIGSSQISYHRLYETTFANQAGIADTFFYHMSSTTVAGDILAMGTKRVGDSAMDFEDLSVIFTKHDSKGNVDWSRELDLGQDTVKFLGPGSVGKFEFNGTADSLLFVMGVEINGERTEIFGKLDANGNELDLRTVGGVALNMSFSFPNAAPFINQSDLIVTSSIQPTISRVGLGDELIWSRSYEFINSDGDSSISIIRDIATTLDSTIALLGLGEGVASDFVVAELDSNGVQIWAESYTFPVNNLINISPEAIAPLADGNFAVAGNYLTGGGLNTEGFVALIDTSGSILLSKILSNEDAPINISNLIEVADGTLSLSGLLNTVDSTKYFTTNMNLDGTINWTTTYPQQEAGFGPRSTSLLNVQATGGTTLIGHGFLNDQPVMQVMRHDNLGQTSCSVTDSIILEDLMIVADTLTSSVANGGIFFDSLDFELSNFARFTPPVLTIVSEMQFCPNEIIDTFLVASVSGVAKENISYMWGDGEFTDTIAIDKEGMYMVTVTITEDVCYMMCDTIEITRLTTPTVDIDIDNSRYCDEKIFVLNSVYTPGAPNPTYLWENGETTPSIEVTQEGQYSVTVTDECNEMANADINILFPSELSLEIVESKTFDIVCTNGGHKLNAVAQGGVGGFTYSWSTGESGSEIFVSTDGTYTVTATDACGDEISESIVVDVQDIPETGAITFTLECDEDNAALSRITFEATSNIDNGLIKLNVFDAEDNSIVISEDVIPTDPLLLGNYYVVLSTCDFVELATLTINAEALCGGLLRYPIAFFPGGQDPNSTKFGPIPNDTMSVENIISDIEFKVFNRWGETVFESNELLDSWDGSHKGEPAPSEVYIWYMSYIVEGVEMLDKGDVTLIR